MDLMNAAAFSRKLGSPLNVVVTINARELQRRGVMGLSRGDLMERMRKWAKERGFPWAAIWVREYARHCGEHWHIGVHMPRQHRTAFAAQVAAWTGVAVNSDAVLKDGDVAYGAGGLWHIVTKRRDGPQGGPENIAAYFGKSEPDKVQLYGKTAENPDKVRRVRPGGDGPLAGQRYGISRTLNRKAQAERDFTPPHQRRAKRASQRHLRPSHGGV